MTKRKPAKRTKVKTVGKLSQEGRRQPVPPVDRDVEEQVRLGRKFMREYRETFEKLAKG